MYHKLLTVLFIFTLSFLFGQEPAYKQYTVKNGLPPNSYFYIGYTNDSIFICTDGVGIYTFNGVNFKKYPCPESKYIFKEIHFLKKGYFTRNTQSHYWYKYLGGKWETIWGPKTNIVFRDTLFGFVEDSIFFFDENNFDWQYLSRIVNKSVTLDLFHPYIYHDSVNNQLLTLRKKSDIYKLYNIDKDKFIKVPEDSLFCEGSIFNDYFYLNEYTGDIKWKEEGGKRNVFDILPLDTTEQLQVKNKFNEVFNIGTNVIEQINTLTFFSIDSFLKINYSGTLNLPRANYKKINENLYFVGGFEGMFLVNPNITYYSPQNSNINKNIRTIIKHKGQIWAGSYGSGFCKLDSNDFVKIQSPFLNEYYKNILSGGFALTDKEAWFFNEGDNTIFILKNNIVYGYEIYSNLKRSWAKGFYIDTLNDGRLAFSLQYDNFGILDSVVENRVYLSTLSDKYGLKHGNTWNFDQDKNDRVWLSRYTAGISAYDINKDKVVQFQYSLSDKTTFGVLSLYIDQFDQMWLGTTKGVYLVTGISEFDIYSDNILKKAIPFNLPNNDKSLVSSIKKVGNYIVIGNRTGLSFIPDIKYSDISKPPPIHQLIYGIDVNGIDTELNGMYYDNKRYLWVSTKSGVLKIDMEAIRLDTSMTKISLDYMKSGGNIILGNNNEINISSVKRNIKLRFSSYPNPSFKNNIYFDYLLKNSKGDTILFQYRMNINEINIDYLNPDDYTLMVKTYKNGVIQDSVKYLIKVPYTFGENPWMWFFIAITVLSLLSLFLFYRKEKIKQISKKEIAISNANIEKEHLKVQTIISSFNPHFINNSLHWVQSRYYNDPPMTKMIGRLSANISYIFKKTKAGNAVHSLHDELILVKNYIIIQKLRFDDSFEYIEPSIASLNKFKDIQLIVLQIQIHVENAIEHGIRNRVGSSFVKVELNENEGYYIITITDDGIGRNGAKKIRSRGSNSGIKMLNELYSIYNKNKANPIEMYHYYEDDIFKNDGKFYGTRVSIFVPKKYIFEIESI